MGSNVRDVLLEDISGIISGFSDDSAGPPSASKDDDYRVNCEKGRGILGAGDTAVVSASGVVRLEIGGMAVSAEILRGKVSFRSVVVTVIIGAGIGVVGLVACPRLRRSDSCSPWFGCTSDPPETKELNPSPWLSLRDEEHLLIHRQTLRNSPNPISHMRISRTNTLQVA